MRYCCRTWRPTKLVIAVYTAHVPCTLTSTCAAVPKMIQAASLNPNGAHTHSTCGAHSFINSFRGCRAKNLSGAKPIGDLAGQDTNTDQGSLSSTPRCHHNTELNTMAPSRGPRPPMQPSSSLAQPSRPFPNTHLMCPFVATLCNSTPTQPHPWYCW